MKNYVISLKSAELRRNHIQQEFGQQNIPFEFFDAITPEHALSLVQTMNINYDDKNLTTSELACFMSHVSLWKRIIDENLEYIAIFEDDIYLGGKADFYLTTSDWIESNWHVIKLEAFAKRTFLSKSHTLLGQDRNIYQLKGKNYGTAGYILSVKGAEVLLSYIKQGIQIPLDHVMFENFIFEQIMPVYQMNPALCIQDMMLHHRKDHAKSTLPSLLIRERGERMRAEKKTFLQKIKREILRVVTQLRILLFARKITFR